MTSRSQLARAVVWGESDTGDYRRFPARPVHAGPDRFDVRRPPQGSQVPPAAVRRISVQDGDRRVERDLTQFPKSVLSALVGIAVDEGRIGSVDDPITRYVRDLRALALHETEVEESGRRFHYNNFNPLLVGLALERAAGMPVASYLEAKLWRPLGMEADGSWSLDSQVSGFEKMQSGLNARAADFARFGLLFARDGAFRGRQLVPASWVRDPTLMPTRVAAAPARSYQFFWWVQDDRSPPAFFARGKYGQHIYVVPDQDLVLVRFGRDTGYPHWPELLSDIARQLDESTSGKTS